MIDDCAVSKLGVVSRQLTACCFAKAEVFWVCRLLGVSCVLSNALKCCEMCSGSTMVSRLEL